MVHVEQQLFLPHSRKCEWFLASPGGTEREVRRRTGWFACIHSSKEKRLGHCFLSLHPPTPTPQSDDEA